MQQILRNFLNFEIGNIKNKEFCKISCENAKLSAELMASYQGALFFFRSIFFKVMRLLGQNNIGIYEISYLSVKIILGNLQISYSKI